MKKLRITVEGKSYEVLVEMLNEAPSTVTPSTPAPVSIAQAQPVAAPAPAVAAPGPASPPPTSAGANDITSPLAGKVVSIDVAIGASVADGTQVATLEAMKMNTIIYASRGGRVAAVLVNPGDGVDEGSVLLRLE